MKFLGPYIPESMPTKDKDKQKGCQVFFPGTCFFKDEKIDFIMTNDRDYCITWKSGKGAMLDIRQDLEAEYKVRNNMSELHQVQKAVTETYDRLFATKSTDPSVMSQKLSK